MDSVKNEPFWSSDEKINVNIYKNNHSFQIVKNQKSKFSQCYENINVNHIGNDVYYFIVARSKIVNYKINEFMSRLLNNNPMQIINVSSQHINVNINNLTWINNCQIIIENINNSYCQVSMTQKLISLQFKNESKNFDKILVPDLYFINIILTNLYKKKYFDEFKKNPIISFELHEMETLIYNNFNSLSIITINPNFSSIMNPTFNSQTINALSDNQILSCNVSVTKTDEAKAKDAFKFNFNYNNINTISKSIMMKSIANAENVSQYIPDEQIKLAINMALNTLCITLEQAKELYENSNKMFLSFIEKNKIDEKTNQQEIDELFKAKYPLAELCTNMAIGSYNKDIHTLTSKQSHIFQATNALNIAKKNNISQVIANFIYDNCPATKSLIYMASGKIPFNKSTFMPTAQFATDARIVPSALVGPSVSVGRIVPSTPIPLPPIPPVGPGVPVGRIVQSASRIPIPSANSFPLTEAEPSPKRVSNQDMYCSENITISKLIDEINKHNPENINIVSNIINNTHKK
jgi:hypothetical protein